VAAKRRVCSRNECIKFQVLKFITKRDNVRIHWGALVQILSPCKTNKYYVFWECVFSLRYPACHAHAPYFHLWPVRLYNNFHCHLINGTIFEESLPNIKCVFWSSPQLSSETFFILRRRYNYKYTLLRIKNISDEICGEDKNTHFMFGNLYIGLRVKCPLSLSDFNEIWIFLDRLS